MYDLLKEASSNKDNAKKEILDNTENMEVIEKVISQLEEEEDEDEDVDDETIYEVYYLDKNNVEHYIEDLTIEELFISDLEDLVEQDVYNIIMSDLSTTDLKESDVFGLIEDSLIEVEVNDETDSIYLTIPE